MKYLLDTHVFLWAQMSPEVLSVAASAILHDPTAELFLSAASAQEIAIKWRLGKLKLPVPAAEYVESRRLRSRITPLPITVQHGLHLSNLPDLHGDPFDRTLIAQAQFEGMTLLTRDAFILSYPITTIAA